MVKKKTCSDGLIFNEIPVYIWLNHGEIWDAEVSFLSVCNLPIRVFAAFGIHIQIPFKVTMLLPFPYVVMLLAEMTLLRKMTSPKQLSSRSRNGLKKTTEQ